MKYRQSQTFRRRFRKLPRQIQDVAYEKFKLFEQDPRHNSLRTRKMQGTQNIWEGHVTREYVFTFRIIEEQGERIIESLDIGLHDEVYARAEDSPHW